MGLPLHAVSLLAVAVISRTHTGYRRHWTSFGDLKVGFEVNRRQHRRAVGSAGKKRLSLSISNIKGLLLLLLLLLLRFDSIRFDWIGFTRILKVQPAQGWGWGDGEGDGMDCFALQGRAGEVAERGLFSLAAEQGSRGAGGFESPFRPLAS